LSKVNGTWIVTCQEACQTRRAAPAQPRERTAIGDLGGIMALFEKAEKHLKRPSIVVNVPGAKDFFVHLSLFGAKSKYCGDLKVSSNEKTIHPGQDFPSRDWFGSVSRERGTWFASRECRHPDLVVARLKEFAAEPARVAAEASRLLGVCCFCRHPLKDERSTAVGYGRDCAAHYGLPWGDRPEEFAGEAVPKKSKEKGDDRAHSVAQVSGLIIRCHEGPAAAGKRSEKSSPSTRPTREHQGREEREMASYDYNGYKLEPTILGDKVHVYKNGGLVFEARSLDIATRWIDEKLLPKTGNWVNFPPTTEPEVEKKPPAPSVRSTERRMLPWFC